MAVKSCILQIDTRQHEIGRQGTPMFPCGGYFTTIGEHDTKLIPWHWHEEIEVLLIASGVLRIEVPNHSVMLTEGQAAFINSSALHSYSANYGICEVKSLVFDPQLIFGSLESIIEQKYVRPLVNSPELNMIDFKENLKWHQQAIHLIDEAFVHYQKESFGYELLVRDCLSKLWLLVLSNQRQQLEHCRSYKNTETDRVKKMLGYIHSHYTEQTSLTSISNAAAVSEREGLRCFNDVLGTTPMKYMLNYRISVAAGLLINSAYNITEICKLSGFESPSYFSLKFRKLLNMTPSEYRRQKKEPVES